MKRTLLFLSFLISTISFSQVKIGSDIDGVSFGGRLGVSVSLSSDGTVIAIGEPFDLNQGDASGSGSVRVYENIGGVWTQIGSDIEAEGNQGAIRDVFGWSVSLSSDGNVLAIGAPSNEGNGIRSGHVRVYENIGGVWTQIGSDIDGEAAGDRLGSSVSLSSDGSIVAIGGYENNGNGNRSGHVRIYENIGGVWTQIGSDIDGEAADDISGQNVSLSGDGNIVAIGAILNDGNGNNSGHVRIYENIGGVWTQIGSDIDGEVAEDQSGSSISLSNDGTIVAIGTVGNDGNGDNSGHVRVYKNIGGVWTQIGSDIDGEATEDQSGSSISLSSDGSILAVGAIGNDGNGDNSGHVRVYKNIGGVWTQIGTDINGENIGDQSGSSVSLSSNGSILAIGADRNDAGGLSHHNKGHVRVYDLSAVLSTDEFITINTSIYPNPAEDKITIKLKENLVFQQATIYNTLGKLVHTSVSEIINIKEFSAGLYFIEIETSQGKARKKLVIN